MKKYLRLLVLLSMVLGTASASAARIVVAHDGAVVRVSATEPNLVEAQNGRVAAFVFTEGKFTETIDVEAGVVYFRPLEEGPHSGFVEVIDENGERVRYSLIVVPDPDWPAQRIVLQGPPAATRPPALHHTPTTAGHVAAVKQLLRGMLAGTAPSNPPLDGETRAEIGVLLLTRLALYPSGGLVGELHRVQNTSTELAIVDEQSLHVTDDVLAVMVPVRELKPRAVTEVFVVRANQ